MGFVGKGFAGFSHHGKGKAQPIKKQADCAGACRRKKKEQEKPFGLSLLSTAGSFGVTFCF